MTSLKFKGKASLKPSLTRTSEMNTQIEMNANLASKDQSISIDEGKQSNEERV
jgi:hypothetical protein